MGKKRIGKLPAIRVEAKGLDGGTVKVPGSAGPPSAVPPNKSQSSIVKTSSMESIVVDGDLESAFDRQLGKVTDEASLRSFIEVWNQMLAHKLQLRQANTSPSYEEFEKLISSKKLDSNLKKCTSFVKKVRQYSEAQKASIENDLKTLNLSKYLSEIATALTEARFKVSEVQDVVQICSWIHQRYSEFSGLLLENMKRAYPIRKGDMSGIVLSKLAVDLRVISDLVTCGVLPSPDGPNLLVNIIRNMISLDKEGSQCLIPILAFCRCGGEDFMGIIPRNISNLLIEYKCSLQRSEIFACDKKMAFRMLLKDYFNTVVKTLLRVHDEQLKSELYNRKLLQTRGEIQPDRKEAHLNIVNKVEKYKSMVSKLADALCEDLPELSVLPVDPEDEEERALLMADNGEELATVPGIVIFEDEETRAFYQDFKDLKVHLPPVAYRDTIQQTAEQTQAIEEKEKELDNFDDALEEAELQEDKSPDAEEDAGQDNDSELPPSNQIEKEVEEMDKQIKPSFQVFLNTLPHCVNRNMIDKAATEFAENFNIKTNRKKLVQTLFKVPRQRLDLIAFYSRLVAILNPVMPDIGLELCQLLRNDFSFLVRKKHQIFIETKTKIIRFIGELVNFKIFPKSDALQCFKTLLMNFVHHQVEMACVFVETCGRILYRTPDSHRRMKIYLEEMIRKKTVKTLEPRYVFMIDHAYSIVCPPDVVKVEIVRTPLDLYLESLLVDDLSRDSLDVASQQLNMLDWGDEDTFQLAVKYLTMPWKMKTQQYFLCAQLLVGLLKYEPDVVTHVVDVLIEEIRRGIENPAVKNNQRRIATIHYISDLYYYRVVGTTTMFNILYMFITYGVSLDSKSPNKLDPPDNLFRIRLVCMMLKENGSYLGSKKKKLKAFLLYFQVYYWYKQTLPCWAGRSFPYAITELYEEVFRDIFPNFKLATSYEDAQSALADLDANLQEKIKEDPRVSKPPMLQNITEACEDIAEEEADNAIPGNYNTDMVDIQNKINSAEASRYYSVHGRDADPNDVAEGSEDEINEFHSNAVCKLPNDNNMEPTPEEEEEFDRLLESMCTDFSYASTGSKNTKADIAIPLHIRSSSHSTASTKDGPPTYNEPSFPFGPSGDSAATTVPFVMICRKGKKQDFKTLEVPSDSDFVKRIKSREEAERAEKESVKKRTLAINEIQEAEEREKEKEAIKSMFHAKPAPGVQTDFTRPNDFNDTNNNFKNPSRKRLIKSDGEDDSTLGRVPSLSDVNHLKFDKYMSKAREKNKLRSHWRHPKEKPKKK